MNAVRSLLASVATGFLLAGCEAPVHTRHDPDTDFSKFRTWSFAPEVLDREAPVTPSARNADQVMRYAIEEALNGRGYVQLPPDRAQLLVVYHVSLAERMQASDIDRSYGPDNAYSGRQMMGSPTARPYDEGGLAVDLIEAEGRKLVWRGIGHAKIAAGASSSDVGRAIQETVTEVMQEFPPE